MVLPTLTTNQLKNMIIPYLQNVLVQEDEINSTFNFRDYIDFTRNCDDTDMELYSIKLINEYFYKYADKNGYSYYDYMILPHLFNYITPTLVNYLVYEINNIQNADGYDGVIFNTTNERDIFNGFIYHTIYNQLIYNTQDKQEWWDDIIADIADDLHTEYDTDTDSDSDEDED